MRKASTSAWDKPTGGPGAERRVTNDSNWRNPIKWNRQAEAAGTRTKVFCASMADIFDGEAPAEARERLWDLIRVTPFLDWQLQTKRPTNIARFLPKDWGDGYVSTYRMEYPVGQMLLATS